MAAKLSCILLLLALAMLMVVVDSNIINDAHFDVANVNGGGRGSGGLPTCNGAVGDCIDEDEEMMTESGLRRSLRGRSYISYSALMKDTIPCGKRGRSYYHCGGASKANPYSRGCSKITYCWRNLS